MGTKTQGGFKAEAYDAMRAAFAAAQASWAKAGGCVACAGLGWVERNFSDTLDYTDYQRVHCSACHGDAPSKAPGKLAEWPDQLAAEALQRSYAIRRGRWARSLTTRGAVCGIEGAIVEHHHDQVMVLTTDGRRVRLYKFEIYPAREMDAMRMTAIDRKDSGLACDYWLAAASTHARNMSEAVDVVVQSLADSIAARRTLDWINAIGKAQFWDAEMVRELRDAVDVRCDQLAEQEPPENTVGRWVPTSDGWRIKAFGLRPGRVFVRTRSGRAEWVECVSVDANGLGVPAPRGR